MLPEFILPHNLIYAVTPLLLGLVLDVIYPEHRGLLLKIHPVRTCFLMSRALGKPYSSRLRGVAVWFLCVSTHLTLYGVLLYLSWIINPLIWVLTASYIVKVSASTKLLLDTVRKAATYAKESNLEKAMEAVQGIVRRDLSGLEEGYVLSAAVESLAESLVDGTVSPTFYYVFLGPLGSLLQRLANTLDGSLGFKTPEYLRVGWFSAKVDTCLNYVPARLTAALILMVSKFAGIARSGSWGVYRKYCSATESLNAGHPIAAMSASLRVRLEKVGHYVIGVEYSLPTAEDVEKSLRIATYVLITWFPLVALATSGVTILLGTP